ncbi:MAG TPA: DUF885 domain-containing protein [Kofleriaceae bacterium]|nr:DUF885 domain-containing protein [Kofleriaceae bacterium]
MQDVRRVVIAILVASCGGHATPAPHDEPGPLAAQAVAGVDDAALKTLLADHWDWDMRNSPTWATTLGDHRFDDRLPAIDASSLERERREARAFLDRANLIDATALDARDRVTLALFISHLDGAVASIACHSEEWSVSPRGNPLIELSDMTEQHIVTTVDDGDHLLLRLRAAPKMIDDSIANLARGLEHGRVAPAQTVKLTIDQLDQELARPTAEWKMSLPATVAHDAWPAADRARYHDEYLGLVERQIKPAVARYRDFLRDQVLPAARWGAKEGLGGLPDGAACYRARILAELGEPRTPEELHALGLAEIAKSDARIAELGASVLGTKDLKSTIERLRTDRSLYFSSKDELLAAATADLARAKDAIPRFFGRLPKADCVVREIPANEAPFTTIAYYREPHLDGSKPGEFFVNTYKPEVRPRYELATLAAHESIPGHHLQIAIAQELGDVPIFRRTLGTTAFVEGWALYTERLADEMGLYASDFDRLGAASFDAWRGARLVVDTGLHAGGWTRAQAEQFMREHTALTEENIKNEVDRYISWPAQALAYKVGQLDILALRKRAQDALGDRFDLRAFHDVVLGGGAVTLPVLDAQVDAWIAVQQRR